MYNNWGLTKEEVEKIVNQRLEENADLTIGVDDPEINELVKILVDSFSKVISKNNDRLKEEITDYIDEALGKKSQFGHL